MPADPAEQLALDIAVAIGTPVPALLDADAPVLVDDPQGELYFVGLIGGKDVGKTSLVNAIAGQTIAEPTGHGEGTRFVTAYAHRDVIEEVRGRAGDITVVPHEVDELRRQVLLDLPDIDSKYADHIALTRSMLRHMLYPVWVQSVEKYADARPQELLRQVAAGNDPANFVFVLNKCDQLIDREGLEAAGELAIDYAARLGRVLRLPRDPEVLLVSARRPEQYDLPQLRKMLGVQRSAKQVQQSKALAVRRRSASLIEWVGEQDLAGRLAATSRVLDDAGELVGERLGGPILEEALPRLEQDAAHRLGLAEPAVRARMRAWPIVNLLDAAFSPVVLLIRKNLAPAGGESAAVDVYLAETGRSTARNVQAAFAQLNNAYPEIGRLYGERRLWEPPAAELAAGDLRRRLTATLEAQRRMIAQRFRPVALYAPIRWLLTVGAVLWFVLIQPILQIMLPKEWTGMSGFFSELARESVVLLSATALLTNVGFVVFYLVALWATLRFSTYRRVTGLRRRMIRDAGQSPDTSLAANTVEWMQDLLAPLERRQRELSELSLRADHLREQLVEAR